MAKDPGGANPQPKPPKPGAVYNPLWWTTRGWKLVNGKWVKPGSPGKKPPLPKPKPTATNPTGGGGSGGGSYGSGGGGGGGGGGGATGKGLSTYIQQYRLKFIPGGKPPADLLKKATDNNWSLAYFDQQVRKDDPHYMRSIEAKKVLPEFAKTMKMLFPGLAKRGTQGQLMQSSFYKRMALWYLKNGVSSAVGGVGAEQLYGHITNTNKWNQANPYYKQYQRNADIAVQGEANPLVYKQLHSALKQSFKDMGMDLPDDYYGSFFKSRYASSEGIKDLATNLNGIAQQSGSLGWFQGQSMDRGQIKTAAFDTEPAGLDLRSKMNKAFGVRNSFLGSEQKGFDTSLSQGGKLVRPNL